MHREAPSLTLLQSARAYLDATPLPLTSQRNWSRKVIGAKPTYDDLMHIDAFWQEAKLQQWLDQPKCDLGWPACDGRYHLNNNKDGTERFHWHFKKMWLNGWPHLLETWSRCSHGRPVYALYASGKRDIYAICGEC